MKAIGITHTYFDDQQALRSVVITGTSNHIHPAPERVTVPTEAEHSEQVMQEGIRQNLLQRRRNRYE